MEQTGVKGFVQGPNSDITLLTLGFEVVASKRRPNLLNPTPFYKDDFSQSQSDFRVVIRLTSDV